MSSNSKSLEGLVEPGGCEQHPTAGRVGSYCLGCTIIPAPSGVTVGEALFPEVAAAPDRLTVDTITSDALDALQLRAARMEHATKQAAELAVRLEDAEDTAEQHARNTETVARERESYRKAWKEAQRMRAKAEQRAEAASRLGTQYMTAAELAEAAIARVHDLHRKASHGDTCVYCAHGQRLGYDTTWPCDTIRALAEPCGSAATEATELGKTARVFAALHQSAEQDVTRVIALYEQWVKAGPPPLGTSVSRWWDARLVELHAAIRPTAEAAAAATEPVLGAESLVDVKRVVDEDGEPLCTCTYGQRCPNCRD